MSMDTYRYGKVAFSLLKEFVAQTLRRDPVSMTSFDVIKEQLETLARKTDATEAEVREMAAAIYHDIHPDTRELLAAVRKPPFTD